MFSLYVVCVCVCSRQTRKRIENGKKCCFIYGQNGNGSKKNNIDAESQIVSRRRNRVHCISAIGANDGLGGDEMCGDGHAGKRDERARQSTRSVAQNTKTKIFS